MSSLLSLRNSAKSKKPEFERQDVNKYPQFKGQWRKPKGIHSKLRKGLKGHKAKPSIGYSSPTEVKGLTRSGLKPVIVSTVKQLENLGKDNAIIVSATLGLRAKLNLLNKALEKGLNVSNVKDVNSFINKAKEKFESKKNTKKAEENKNVKTEGKKDEPKK